MAGAGNLNQRITLQQRAATQDGLGQAAGVWQDVATVWGRAQPLRGREFFAAGQTQAAAEVKFTIRYRAGLLPSMRVLWRGQPHDMVAPPIEVEGGREYLELMCATGVRDGR